MPCNEPSLSIMWAMKKKRKKKERKVKEEENKDVQKLLDDKTMLLEYFVADSSTYLFVLTKKELKLHQINISKTDLNKEIGEFRNALSNYKFITEKRL